MKKLFALLLTGVMLVSMAACAPAEPAGTTTEAPKGTTTATTTAAVTTTEEGPTPWDTFACFDLTGIAADNKINVGLAVSANVTDYHDNAFTKYLEDLTGLEIEFTFFSSDADEAKQQLNLMAANKEKLPDVLFGIMDSTLASEYGQEGLLCDITGFLEKSVRLQTYIATMSELEANYMWQRLRNSITGEIYAVPSPSIVDGADGNAWMGAINKTMAAKFGMDPAEIDTIDEVYEFLTKVVKEDGNGNGKADEIGLLYKQNPKTNNGEIWLINAYVYCNDEYLFNVNDGEVWVPYNTDEYRQALVTMNKWYKEGLISPLSYSLQNVTEFKALVEVGQGNYNIGMWVNHPTLVCNAASAGGNIGLDYTYLNTLGDETGKGGYANMRDIYALNQSAYIPMNEAEPERMELGYLFCDIMYDFTTYTWARYGVEGVNWERMDGEAEGLKDRNGDWAGFRVLEDAWSTPNNSCWHYNPIYIDTTGSYEAGLTVKVPLDTSSYATTGNRAAISMGCKWEKMEHEMPEEVIYAQIYTAEETEVIDEYFELYREYVLQARAEMVTGAKDPNNDADWAAYLAELKANGEDELIEVAQDAYSRTNG